MLASRFDNNPCVLVEAQAAGLAHRREPRRRDPGDRREATACSPRRRTPAELAERILEALAGRWDRTAIAARAAERYSIEHVAQTFADVYADALA